MANTEHPSNIFSGAGKLSWLVVSLLCLGAMFCVPKAGLAGSALVKNASLTPVTLQLRWMHQFQFAGYYAAKAKGYYREAGLDVTIRERSSGQDPIAEVLEGRAHFGVTNSEILLHALHGKPLSVLAAIFQHSPLALLVRDDSRMITPHDLVGRRIKMSLLLRDVELQAMFLNEGIELAQLTLVQEDANQMDYLDPSIDALATYITNQPYYLKQRRIGYHLITPRRYGINFYGDCLFTSHEMLEKQEDVVEAFVNASLRGWEYAMAHQEEIVDLILAEYSKKKSRAHLLFEARQTEKLILPSLVQIGHMNADRWQHIATVFTRLGLVDSNKITKKFMDAFIHSPKAHSKVDTLHRLVWVLAGGGLIIAFIALFQFIVAKRMRLEIHRRKKAEKALRASETYHRILFENTGSSIVVIRGDGIISLANKKSEELFKLSREQIVAGRHWIEFIAPKDREWLLEMDHKRRQGQAVPSAYEFLFQNGQGEFRNVYLTLGQLPGKAGAVCALNDITPRIQAEQEREEVIAELEIKNEELERFAYTVSHDLKSPLITIKGFLGIMEEALAEKDNNLVQESMQRITDASETMLTLLDELLELARVGRVGQEQELVSLTKLAREAANDTLGILNETNTTVTVADDLPVSLCDPVRIQEVFQNLFENAARYGDATGPTLVTVTHRTEETEAGQQDVIVVRDNGMGIDSKYTERIFNLFEQLAPGNGGTGIGLALVKRIIEHHGGKVWVESKGLGHGAAFCFTLGKPK